MDGRARRIDRQSPHDTSLQICDFEAERLKPGPEEHVLFKAISAASTLDHLAAERLDVEPGKTTEHDIESFIGDRPRMGKDQPVERLECWRRRARIANAFKPGDAVKLWVGHVARALPIVP